MQKKSGKTSQRFQRFQERDYMDPNQGLCLGALFDIAATNVGNLFIIYLGLSEHCKSFDITHGDAYILL